MGLDIRWPIGLMFSIIGVLMVAYGAITGANAEVYKRSLDINVNLYWGLLLLVFGAFMLLMAWRDAKKANEAAQAGKPGETAPRR